MKPWTRDDTKKWINSLEGRLSDFTYYLKQTANWCSEHEIESERTIFMCCFLTCVWVSQLRDENISYKELLELLGIEELNEPGEKLYELGPDYLGLDHIELLEKIVKMTDL